MLSVVGMDKEKEPVTYNVMAKRGWTAKKVGDCWAYADPNGEAYTDPDEAFASFASQHYADFFHQIHKHKLEALELLPGTKRGVRSDTQPASAAEQPPDASRGGHESEGDYDGSVVAPPKRPHWTAYTKFVQENLAGVISSMPHSNRIARLKELGKRWRLLSQAQKDGYKNDESESKCERRQE